MSTKPTLPKLEIIAFFIFGIFFLLWAFKQCTTDTPYLPQQEANTSSGRPANNGGTSEEFSRLYVIVDSLNMRTAPHLDSLVVQRIPRNQGVEFYGMRTSFKQKININNTTKHEPWVYIRTQIGRKGWVYAGGLSFYRQ